MFGSGIGDQEPKTQTTLSIQAKVDLEVIKENQKTFYCSFCSAYLRGENPGVIRKSFLENNRMSYTAICLSCAEQLTKNLSLEKLKQ